MTRSLKTGTDISKIDISNISSHGLWIYIIDQEKEYFLSYEEYPWFKEARIRDILNVRFLHGYHLYWPALDVDLELESIKDSENYPLVYK